jgi:hypothetical protein
MNKFVIVNSILNFKRKEIMIQSLADIIIKKQAKEAQIYEKWALIFTHSLLILYIAVVAEKLFMLNQL